jgi:hypothetical protein
MVLKKTDQRGNQKPYIGEQTIPLKNIKENGSKR